jgi:putative hydroxymethylpyrimidine transporter CytX
VSATVTTSTSGPQPPPGEAPYTLEQPAPRVLSFWDQVGLWGNLGVSLLGPVGAIFVLYPTEVPLSLLAALTATVVGTLIGSLFLGASAVPGAQTGAPSMVLLRGLFGRRLSYLPTALNVAQLIGWSVFEIVVIAQAAEQLLPWKVRWPYVVIAGALTTAMAIRPLGVVRILRRYALAAVLVATAYLFVQLLRHPLPPLTRGSWHGFWLAVDYGIALAVSWVPLASDYSRHSRSTRSAFGGAFLGYAVTQILYFTLGIVALVTVVKAGSDQDVLAHDMFAAFIAVPVGWLGFAVLVLRELDQSFADTYSTVVSIQNAAPRLDRRALALVLGPTATVLALVLEIKHYQDFLLLIGSVFVPMFAVFVVDYFVLGRGRGWDVSPSAPARWWLLLPWAGGFFVYQLVNPGYVTWWQHQWAHLQQWLHFTPASWMSASLLSFAAAAVLTLLVELGRGVRRTASE